MEQCGGRHREWSRGEIATELGLNPDEPVGTFKRALTELVKRGVIVQPRRGRYALGEGRD